MSLENSHVVVVGGGSGIGPAVTEALVSRGARVTISSRNAGKLNNVANALGDRVSVAQVDMTDEASVGDWATRVGSVDHLVITASSAAHGRFSDLGISRVRDMFDSKFFGPYLVAREMLPYLSEGGSITFFSGVLSRRPGLNCSGLGAVNSAIEGLTRGLALELGPGIRVNCCSPGMIRSDAYSNVDEDAREKMYQATGESLPVQRVGLPGEIAEAVLFLMTNAYTTGIVLDVDGGHMIRQYAKR